MATNNQHINNLKFKIMPQGDRTGPMGQGSRTGRSSGFCTGNDTPGNTRGFGKGMHGRAGVGRGWGRGMGFGKAYSQSAFGLPRMTSKNKEDEIKLLKSQAEELKRLQQALEKKLGEMTKDNG
jgi:hypothetical protein